MFLIFRQSNRGFFLPVMYSCNFICAIVYTVRYHESNSNCWHYDLSIGVLGFYWKYTEVLPPGERPYPTFGARKAWIHHLSNPAQVTKLYTTSYPMFVPLDVRGWQSSNFHRHVDSECLLDKARHKVHRIWHIMFETNWAVIVPLVHDSHGADALQTGKQGNGKCAGMWRLPTPGQAIIGVEFPWSLGLGWGYHLLRMQVHWKIGYLIILQFILCYQNILIGITLYGSDYKTLESLKTICSRDICHPQLREIFGKIFCFCLTFYEGCGIVSFVE